MLNKIKKWLKSQQKDIKILIIFFIIAFVLNLIFVKNFSNALLAGLTGIFTGAIFINAIRFWKKIFKKTGFSANAQYQTIDLNKEETMIFNELIIELESKQHQSDAEVDKIIEQKIKNLNLYTENWQIHYAKERIKQALKKL